MPSFSILTILKLRNFLKRIRTVLINHFTTSHILTIHRIIEELRAENLKATLLCADFSKVFDFIQRGNIGQILVTYALSKETVTAIIMFYTKTEAEVHSSDGDSGSFDIFAGVLQVDILITYLFIFCQDYVLRTSLHQMKENYFSLKRYEADDIPNADYIHHRTF